MTKHVFRVEQRPLPGSHEHSWVAVEEGSGAEIDLPQGGNGAFLGRYPEIAAHLLAQGIKARLSYSRALGDTVDLDYSNDRFTWSFKTANGVVVEDIPRLVAGFLLEG